MGPIIQYIKDRYQPLALIVYGSYADGSNNAHSDFDALALTASVAAHDVSFVDGVQLDLFVRPATDFQGKVDWSQYAQLADGKLVLDTDGAGQALLDGVRAYLDALPHKTLEEKREEVAWCEKMALRSRRGDAEGLFRWHWVLTDSLEICCDLLDRPYRGPKKSLRWLEREHPDIFQRYLSALSGDLDALDRWVVCLREQLEK